MGYSIWRIWWLLFSFQLVLNFAYFLYEFKAQITLMLSLLGLVLEMQCGLIDHRVSENCGKFNLVPSSWKRHIGPPQLFLLDFLQDTWVNEIRTSLACHLNSGG